jgi:uncharacterized membrane protein
MEKTTEKENALMEMSFKLMVALAKRNLKDKHNGEGNWPLRQEWNELAPSSQTRFMRMARTEAGVDHDFYLKEFRSSRYDIDWHKIK